VNAALQNNHENNTCSQRELVRKFWVVRSLFFNAVLYSAAGALMLCIVPEQHAPTHVKCDKRASVLQYPLGRNPRYPMYES
jgi:hypothetical protein